MWAGRGREHHGYEGYHHRHEHRWGGYGIAGNNALNGGQEIDRWVGDKGDRFRHCDGNVVEVPVLSNASAPTKAGH
jgi:hypothetical protein